MTKFFVRKLTQSVPIIFSRKFGYTTLRGRQKTYSEGHRGLEYTYLRALRRYTVGYGFIKFFVKMAPRANSIFK